jgi:hypothetical protein
MHVLPSAVARPPCTQTNTTELRMSAVRLFTVTWPELRRRQLMSLVETNDLSTSTETIQRITLKSKGGRCAVLGTKHILLILVRLKN